jgi:hypothetical protein
VTTAHRSQNEPEGPTDSALTLAWRTGRPSPRVSARPTRLSRPARSRRLRSCSRMVPMRGCSLPLGSATRRARGGRTNVIAAGSWSTKPLVVIAASHSRKYRSFNRAAAAIWSLVDGGAEAIVSNKPTRCPTRSARRTRQNPARRIPRSSLGLCCHKNGPPTQACPVSGWHLDESLDLRGLVCERTQHPAAGGLALFRAGVPGRQTNSR